MQLFRSLSLLIVIICACNWALECRAEEETSEASLLVDAIWENLLLVRQYDVIVKVEIDEFAANESDKETFPPRRRTEHSRQVMDKDKNRVLRAEHHQGFAESGHEMNIREPWKILGYRDNIPYFIEFRKHNGPMPGRGKDSFEEFLFKQQFPHMELSGRYCYPLQVPRDLVEIRAHDIQAWRDATVRTFPDGIRVLSLKQKTNAITMFIDPRSLLATKWTFKEDGISSGDSTRSERVHKYEFVHEDFAGVFLPTSINSNLFSEAWASDKRRIEIEQFIVVTLEWVQVNPPELQFPDESKLGNELLNWAKFIKLVPTSDALLR